jgi:glycerophosphoryl diester phosphodiesterase
MPTRPLLLGHRGARGEKSVTENTLAAFDFALTQGCDGFEFDVRLAGNGQAVVCHDTKIRGAEVAHTSSQALALPLLRDVLQRYAQTAFLDIELKVPGLEALILDLLKMHLPARGYVISSFLPEVLNAIHSKDAAIPLGLICETQDQFDAWTRSPVQYVIPHRKLIRRSVVADLANSGRKVLVWTVNSKREMKQLADWGVDGLISDDPADLARAVRSKL